MVHQTTGERDNAHFSPPINRSMKVLDRDFFTIKVPLTAIKVLDPREFKTLRTFEMDLLQLHGVTNIVKTFKADGQAADFLILLRPDLHDGELEGMSERMKLYLAEHKEFPLVPYTLELGYKFWKPGEKLIFCVSDSKLEKYRKSR